MTKRRFRYEEKSKSTQPINRRDIEYEIDENGCWICVSHKPKPDGYVRLCRKPNYIYLHRIVYEEQVGTIPEGYVVMHQCDNPTCFNPSHLKIGTNLDNQLDKVRKGRQAAGELNGNSKLTEKQVLEIREDKRTAKELAREFGVTDVTIYDIRNKKYWKGIG